ncbi:uncharacterized protein LOC111276011 [Durio zibethinus]|uniref:Uncharacterized protein LOC111276011 n=1 Tax=Durio zibethinus TaxID=66656 RepID=A0A6P5WMU8_DURZI|nr:uncharacterized protein LOC111276011 [Durio zibethinus]
MEKSMIPTNLRRKPEMRLRRKGGRSLREVLNETSLTYPRDANAYVNSLLRILPPPGESGTVFSPDLQHRNSDPNAFRIPPSQNDLSDELNPIESRLRKRPSQSSVSASQPIPPSQNDLSDELNPLESRLSKSPSQSSVSASQPIPPSQNDLSDELNPPESRLSKSPSQSSVSASQPIPPSQNDLSGELNPPESRLSKSPSQSSVSASQAEDLSSGVKTKAKTAAATDKLKALKFLAAILRIGHWEVNEEWIFLLINVVLEVLLVALEQCASPKRPQFSLIAMVVSIVAMFTCIIELFDRGRKAKVAFKRQGLRSWFYHPSSSEKSFYSFIDMFALISGLVQYIFSVVAYCYHRRGRENPIKVSVVSVIFIICMALSKFTSNENVVSPSFKRGFEAKTQV